MGGKQCVSLLYCKCMFIPYSNCNFCLVRSCIIRWLIIVVFELFHVETDSCFEVLMHIIWNLDASFRCFLSQKNYI